MSVVESCAKRKAVTFVGAYRPNTVTVPQSPAADGLKQELIESTCGVLAVHR